MDAKRFDAIAKTLNLSAAGRLDRIAAALATPGSRRWAVAAAVATLGSLVGGVEPVSGGKKKKRKGRNKKKDRKDEKKPQCIPLVEEPCGTRCCDALNRPCCNGICCDFGWKCCGGDALGRICCQHGCLAPEYPDCCPPGRACGNKCCDEGLVCTKDPDTGATGCCRPNHRVCHGICCYPADSVCCQMNDGTPYCCRKGLKCKTSNSNTCCTGTAASPC